MIGICPYDCDNKTEYGYCSSTGCINPKYYTQPVIITYPYGFDTHYRSPCDGCPNNIENGGSGVCHCILGTPKIT